MKKMWRIAEPTVGAFDAKTNLSQLLDRVEKGETLVITRHGVPVARLMPYKEEAIDREQVRKTIQELKKFSKGRRLPPGETIKDLIEEGRRY
jgi:prevent-host-death family protein